jgi:hypothetical protein
MHLSQEELISSAKILNNSYNPFLLDSQVWMVIKALYPDDICRDFMITTEGHRVVNEILMKYYSGERVIKYHLVKEHLKNEDEITVFEMYVNSSRLDIGRINGESYAYEIKTELDSLEKLHKQVEDYSKAFEHIFIIVHPKHLQKAIDMIPSFCGIKTYYLDGLKCCFKLIRPSEVSPNLDCRIQLMFLASKDLENMIKEHSIKAPRKRPEREAWLLENCDAKEINRLFKISVKKKYGRNWAYLCQIFDDVMPIDVQAFFKTSADPYWMYYKNSSMV